MICGKCPASTAIPLDTKAPFGVRANVLGREAVVTVVYPISANEYSVMAESKPYLAKKAFGSSKWDGTPEADEELQRLIDSCEWPPWS